MRPITRWTLWQKRWSVIWWSLGILAYNGINLGLYPAFRDQAAEFQKAMENIPQSALQFLGGSTDFLSPVGFLNSKVYYMMLPLMLAILVIGLGSSLLAREEHENTIESLLSRPIKRTSLLLSKALAGFLVMCIVSVITLLSIIGISALINLGISPMYYIEASLICLLLVLSFGSVAYFITATGKARGASIGLSSAFALLSYVCTSLSATVSWLKWPSKALPFHYYHPEQILVGSGIRLIDIIYYLSLITIMLGLAVYTFNRRDID